jgi:phosphoribosylformimino-5-aminoimidazole carboxamide ribotide isomerase
MQIIPALDLLGDDAVRLERGDFDRVIFRQPIESFMARIVATNPPLIHIVDLQGARDGAIRPDVIARCAGVAGAIPLQVSGGIRSTTAALEVLAAGAARVIIGTAAWANESSLGEFVHALGERLVVAIDVRNGKLEVRGWTESSGLDVDSAVQRCVEAGVTRVHVTAIDRDGTMRGPDVGLYEHVCQSGLKVVAAGGIRDGRDLDALSSTGCEAVVMGVGYLARLGISLDS